MPLTIFGQQQHAFGTTVDASAAKPIEFTPPIQRLDIAALTNSISIQTSVDGNHYTTPRQFLPGVYASLDIPVRFLIIFSTAAGVPGAFDFVGYSDPMEVVGRPYTPLQ